MGMFLVIWCGITGGCSWHNERRHIAQFWMTKCSQHCSFYGMDHSNFQNDNAVSKATMQWYTDNNVHQLHRPTQSPDINPTEYLLDKLDQRVRSWEIRPNSIDQLSEMLQKEWQCIPIDVLHKLVESMPDMLAVIAARDGSMRF